jgi:hypothetical protein
LVILVRPDAVIAPFIDGRAVTVMGVFLVLFTEVLIAVRTWNPGWNPLLPGLAREVVFYGFCGHIILPR